MKRNKIFAWMVAAMTFAACTNNDITSDTRYDDDNVVTIGTVTRTGEGYTTSQAPSPFLLTNVTQRENVGYDFEATYKYDNSSSTWTAQDNTKNIMWYGSGENVFQATYPCKTKNGNVQINDDFNKFVIPGYQENNSDSIPDWMRADTTVARKNGALEIKFKHMLSKVTVEIDYSNNNIKLDGKAVTGASVSKIFTRVQFCEAVTGTGGNVTINPYQKTDYETDGLYVWTTPQSDAYKAYTTAIVAPGEYSKIAKAVIYCGGDEKEIVLSLPNGITLEAGKHYTFTLSNAAITHDAATIFSVSVEPWTEGTITGTKPAEKIIPYVTFTSNEEVGFMMRTDGYTISGLEYSVNNGEWIAIPSNGISNEVTFGGTNGKLRLRGKNPNGTATYDPINEVLLNYATISFSSDNPNAKVACIGDIRTLLDYSNYKNVNTSNARFSHLFNYCKQLTSAPEFPATTLANSCYEGMFKGCTSLTTAPKLPATTLAENCYFCMFEGCTSLTTAPELPATTLAWQCYCRMFEGCILLETAPKLPATTLDNSCYSNMFNGCTSLTTAPKLKATTLASTCYISMFEKCTKLESVTMLATDGFDKSDCLYGWLKDAGTGATSRTLTVANEDAYNKIVNTKYAGNSALPPNWQAGPSGATILNKDGNDITSDITSSSSTASKR